MTGDFQEITMSQKRLLLVEDEPDLRLMLADSFSDAGFKVLEAEDADRAVRILERLPGIDLLVTDLDIPGRCDGNGVAISAKAIHFDLPVIYISGSPERLTNAVGPRDAFFLKPFRHSEIIALARRILSDTGPPEVSHLPANLGPLPVNFFR
jgi:DNA-binding response OmpR family regulator